MRDTAGESTYGSTPIDERFLQGVSWYRATPQLVYPFVVVGVFGLVLDIRLETLELLYGSELEEALERVLAERAAEQLVGVTDEILWLAVLGTVLLALLGVLAGLIALGIGFLTAADAHAGRTTTQFDRLWVTLGRLPALCVASLLGALLIVAGYLLLILPGVYLTVKLALGGPAIVIDGHGPIEGLRASWAAVAGQFVDVLGVLVLGLLVLVPVALIPVVGELLAAVGVLPVIALALASLYVGSSEGGERTSRTEPV